MLPERRTIRYYPSTISRRKAGLMTNWCRLGLSGVDHPVKHRTRLTRSRGGGVGSCDTLRYVYDHPILKMLHDPDLSKIGVQLWGKPPAVIVVIAVLID